MTVERFVPLRFGEALDAVRRLELQPEGTPVRVVVGAVRSVVSPRLPLRREVDSWDVEAGTGQFVDVLAAAIVSLRRLEPDLHALDLLAGRYGDGAVVHAVSLAALWAAEEVEVPLPIRPRVASLGLSEGVRMRGAMAGLGTQLQTAFATTPPRWKALSRREGAALRWWDVHEGAMCPGALTGEEKWLAMAVLLEHADDPDAADLYAGFLRRQGWTEERLRRAQARTPGSFRRGFPDALEGAIGLLLEGLDRRRVELAGADLSSEAVAELVDLVALARAMVVIGQLV